MDELIEKSGFHIKEQLYLEILKRVNEWFFSQNHPTMKYAYTIFYVDNVEATLQFYEQAFGFSRKFITPEQDYGELISGETTIAFASIALGNSNFKKGFEKISNKEKTIGMEMAFVTENVEKEFQKAIAAGATEFEPITVKPWGQKVGYVKDNNGILIEICTPINPEK